MRSSDGLKSHGLDDLFAHDQLLLLRQVAMDQGDGECPFAHRGCDPLDGLGADIARHEDTRNAGLQQVRVTLQIPGRRPVATGRSDPDR